MGVFAFVEVLLLSGSCFILWIARDFQKPRNVAAVLVGFAVFAVHMWIGLPESEADPKCLNDLRELAAISDISVNPSQSELPIASAQTAFDSNESNLDGSVDSNIQSAVLINSAGPSQPAHVPPLKSKVEHWQNFRRFDAFHLWLLGVTGSGKSTLAGVLSRNASYTGFAGFSHDTLEITQLDTMVWNVPNRTVTAIYIMDTRGFMDADYTVENLQNDVYNHSKYHQSKVAIVVKQERLTRMHFDFLRDAAGALGPLSVVLTGCTAAGVDDFRSIMGEQRIPLLHVMCYHQWVDDKDAKRKEILEHFINAPRVDVDGWYRRGIFLEILAFVERCAYAVAKVFFGSSWLTALVAQLWGLLALLVPGLVAALVPGCHGLISRRR